MPDRVSGRRVPGRKEREDSVAVETNRSEVDESNNDAWAGGEAWSAPLWEELMVWVENHSP